MICLGVWRVADTPKSGSSALAELSDRASFFPHQPAWCLPEGPRLGLFRDPWSWYGSLYTHALHEAKARARMCADTGKNVPTFKDVLRVWTHPKEAIGSFRGWFYPINVRVNAPLLARAKLMDSAVGLATWTGAYFLGGEDWGTTEARWGVDAVVLTERLREDVQVVTGMSADVVNATSFPAPAYDTEMEGWVLEADGLGVDLAARLRKGSPYVARGERIFSCP